MKRKNQIQKTPTLRFTPNAWAKLLFLRDIGATEIGGFGICPEDTLLVEDIKLPQQHCTPTTVVFDDESVADMFDSLVDNGFQPEQFGRIWIHTHPGSCPYPSETDKQTFARVFGPAHWAIMFILAKGGSTFCQLQFNIGPGCGLQIPVEIDYSQQFNASDWSGWEEEYFTSVQIQEPVALCSGSKSLCVDNWHYEYAEIFPEIDWADFPQQELEIDEYSNAS